jgi:hypothetical protein
MRVARPLKNQDSRATAYKIKGRKIKAGGKTNNEGQTNAGRANRARKTKGKRRKRKAQDMPACVDP